MRTWSPGQVLLLVVFLLVPLLNFLLTLWRRRRRAAGTTGRQLEPVMQEAPAQATPLRSVQAARVRVSGERPRQETPRVPAEVPRGARAPQGLGAPRSTRRAPRRRPDRDPRAVPRARAAATRGPRSRRAPSRRPLTRPLYRASDRRVRGLGVRQLRTPVKAPRANALAERWVRSARTECLDHLFIVDERHLQRVLDEYVAYFNAWRPHRGLGQRAPCGSAPSPPSNPTGRIIGRPVHGGLHDVYPPCSLMVGWSCCALQGFWRYYHHALEKRGLSFRTLRGRGSTFSFTLPVRLDDRSASDQGGGEPPRP